MEAIQGEAGDRFASIIQFCMPTSSQEAKLQSCPFGSEFENFAGVVADVCRSSSHAPTQTAKTPIVMVSLPDSYSSQRDEAVFVTPPDHHQHLSSSEDQNVFHDCTKTVDLGDDGPPKEADKRSGDRGGGETVDVNETEVVCLGAGETMKANETEVVCLDSVETVDMDEDTVEVEKQSKSNVTKDGSERENSNKNATLGRGDGGEKSKGKHVKTRDDVAAEKAVLGRVRKRQLPCSLTGKEKARDVVEKKKSKSVLLEFLDVVKALVSDPEKRDDSKDVDFLETAEKQGLKFVRPRWWLPQVDG